MTSRSDLVGDVSPAASSMFMTSWASEIGDCACSAAEEEEGGRSGTAAEAWASEIGDSAYSAADEEEGLNWQLCALPKM